MTNLKIKATNTLISLNTIGTDSASIVLFGILNLFQ